MNSKEKQQFYEQIMSLDSRFSEYLMVKLRRKLGIGTSANAVSSGESLLFDIAKKIASPKSLTIFDVGANTGEYTQYGLKTLNAHPAEFHCFEPSTAAFNKLELQFSKHQSIHLNQLGVSNELGEATLYAESEGSVLASMTPRELNHLNIDHSKYKETIKLVSIDEYCRENKIRHIELLKVDVEGHELDVFNGALGMLNNKAIDLIQFEFGGCNIDTKVFFRDLYQLLDSNGFDIFRILPQRKLLSIPRYRELDEQFSTTNYLASRRDLNIGERFNALCDDVYF